MLIWVWVLVLLGSFVKMKTISAIGVSIPKSERKFQLLQILYHQFQACQRLFWTLYSPVLCCWNHNRFCITVFCYVDFYKKVSILALARTGILISFVCNQTLYSEYGSNSSFADLANNKACSSLSITSVSLPCISL